jgi:hypothetical protein
LIAAELLGGWGLMPVLEDRYINEFQAQVAVEMGLNRSS